ncbi:DNA mismatch repair protein Mlh3 isoform X2 [Pelobates fuscus]|uniref:DNA mismatch repair protein Mlh3 isoform X2 n=1 Tax=Pelobates fuscus TaxID=191477 RepID=UPI002FE4E849
MIRRLTDEVQHNLRSGVAIVSTRQCIEELILNSADSQATCIAVRVDLEAFRVQVVDNGWGVCEDDMAKVGTRYFTSKCHSLKDLENLVSYGFRGEAIASIADVSTIVEISSRCKNNAKTFTKLFQNGKPMQVKEAELARPSTGTTVTIYNLFYNLPVRRKCMDSVLEFERIRRGVEALSLIQPSVSYSLKNDALHSMVLQLPKTKDVRSRFCQIYGLAHSQKLREIQHAQYGFTVSGFISCESHYNKTMQYLYVNKRFVLKTKLHKLIGSMLRKESVICRPKTSPHPGKYHSSPELHAIFLINIQCNCQEYDVCFEPAKTLIEFQNGDLLFHCIEEGVRTFLKTTDLFLEPLKEDVCELKESNNLSLPLNEFHHQENQDRDIYQNALDNYEICNVKSKSVFRSNSKALTTSHNDTREIQTAGVAILDCLVQTPPIAHCECKTSNEIMHPGNHAIIECSEKAPQAYSQVELASDNWEAEAFVLKHPTKESGVDAISNRFTKSKEYDSRTSSKCSNTQDNGDVTDPAFKDDFSMELGNSITASCSKHPRGILGLSSEKDEGPLYSMFPTSGLEDDYKVFGSEHKADINRATLNRQLGELYSAPKNPTVPSKRKVSAAVGMASLVGSLEKFKRQYGKMQQSVVSPSVGNNGLLFQTGSDQNEDQSNLCTNNKMTEMQELSSLLQKPPVPILENTKDSGHLLSGISPLTYSDYAHLKRNDSGQQIVRSSLTAKLSKQKQSMKVGLSNETPKTKEFPPEHIPSMESSAVDLITSPHITEQRGETIERSSVGLITPPITGQREETIELFSVGLITPPITGQREETIELSSVDLITPHTTGQREETIELSSVCLITPHITGQREETIELSSVGLITPHITGQREETINNDCPLSSCGEQMICTPNKAHLDPDIITRVPSESSESSDWLLCYEAFLGRNIFINRVTGMSSYRAPQQDMETVCETELTAMVESTNYWLRSQCYPFWKENLVPLFPQPHGQRACLRAHTDAEDCSLQSIFSQWENPVFERHPSVAVNVSSGQSDTLAVKIHNILYPYRFTKDMIHSTWVLQQVDNKFIACVMDVKKEGQANPDGNLLVLVDQHAAHERVRLEQLIADSYEAVSAECDTRRLKVSAVQPPLELEVTEEQYRLLRIFDARLARVGLSLSFSDSEKSRVLVGSVPLCFVEKEANETQRGRPTVTKRIIEEFLQEQVEMFQTAGAAQTSVPLTVLKVLASQACHGAVKFNDSLTLTECRHLIQALSRCNLPFQCAHGRPAILPLADISHLEHKIPLKPNLRRLCEKRAAWEMNRRADFISTENKI